MLQHYIVHHHSVYHFRPHGTNSTFGFMCCLFVEVSERTHLVRFIMEEQAPPPVDWTECTGSGPGHVYELIYNISCIKSGLLSFLFSFLQRSEVRSGAGTDPWSFL